MVKQTLLCCSMGLRAIGGILLLNVFVIQLNPSASYVGKRRLALEHPVVGVGSGPVVI